MFNCCIKPVNKFGLQSESDNWNASLQASFNCQKDCWICYTGGDVKNLCECKNLKSHKKCLAKWQFKNMGKSEEENCRFCNTKYKCSWKDEFFRKDLLDRLHDVVPEITVTYNNMSKDIKLYNTGYNAFLEIISHFVDTNDVNALDSFECILSIKNCKRLKLNTVNVSVELMNNIIFCAKLSSYKKN
jgi:hypothetical protein